MGETLCFLAGLVLGLRLGRAWKRWEIIHGTDRLLDRGDVLVYFRKDEAEASATVTISCTCPPAPKVSRIECSCSCHEESNVGVCEDCQCVETDPLKGEDARDTPMEQYRKAGRAEYRLEMAVVEAFGGLEACWFRNWYFDTYDSSVELTESENGREPTLEQLQALAAAGIRIVFVSYFDGTARSWRKHHGWAKGECSPRRTDEDRRGIVGALRKEIEELRADRTRLREAIAGNAYIGADNEAWAAIAEKMRSSESVIRPVGIACHKPLTHRKASPLIGR